MSKVVDRYLPAGILLLVAAAFFGALAAADWSAAGLFLTPDQRGCRLLARGEYRRAAAVFRDPCWRGVALYRDGDFKAAAAAFAAVGTPAALYNRANALLMQGKYDQAITGYERVLAVRPGWRAARENLALARARKRKRQPPPDDAGGTGGEQAPDEIVVTRRRQQPAAAKREEDHGGGRLSDREMRALWLRRIETRPADFLRVKFLYQLECGCRLGTCEPGEGRQ
ncbi:MAG: tetratricopeptide repeat protein [Deltaproteobacteria bacterium]|nr:tetratricopeptide repeat protein [Deltaproteobacteria bacterium]